MAKRRGRRVSAGRLVRRWLAVGVLALFAFLYVHPVAAFLEKRAEAGLRAAEVTALEAERASLERRLAEQKSEATIVREARRMQYVKPGEQLFIVKGIAEWRRAQAGHEDGATIGGDG
jgi:cell division protein FtsB